MRHAPAPLLRGLGRADLKLAIQRNRVAVDDFPAKLLRDCDGKGRLAARGRAEDDDQQWISRLPYQVHLQ
jgi:hypothetical protein